MTDAEARHPARLLAAGPPDWAAALLLLGAFVLGWLSDAFTARGRIQLLPPALIGLLAWNLAVYALLGWHAVAGRARPGPLRRALARLALPRGGSQRAWRDAAAAGAPLQGARLAAALHGAALAWTLGAVASIYVGGLFFEYRAGWSSTFIRDPHTLRALLSVLLWPATALTGSTLPDADALARLDFAVGAGENAARWIHWQTLSVASVVLLPRAALAGAALRRARRLAAQPPAPAPTAHVPARRRVASVFALPYSTTLTPAARSGLQRLLDGALGTPLALRLAEPMAQGDEDATPARLAEAGADATVLLLFAATATPERETHGAFLQAATAARAAPGRLLALLDASGWRARFPGADGEARLAVRQAEWQRLFDAHRVAGARVDLAQPDPRVLVDALDAVHGHE